MRMNETWGGENVIEVNEAKGILLMTIMRRKPFYMRILFVLMWLKNFIMKNVEININMECK